MVIDSSNVAVHSFTPYTYNTYAEYVATPRWLFEVCQEAAAMHSGLKHLGVPDLLKEGKTWVITREKMTISRYPRWNNEVTVKTGVPDANSFFAPRTVLGEDENGKEIFRASMMWAVVNAVTRMPVKVGGIYDRIGCVKGPSFVDETLRREPKIDIQSLLAKQPVCTFVPQIFFFDCDINNHINNIVYLDWILRTVPADYMENHLPSMIDIMWIHEVHMNDRVEVGMYEIEKDFYGFVMQRASDNLTVCTAQVRFAGKEDMV